LGIAFGYNINQVYRYTIKKNIQTPLNQEFAKKDKDFFKIAVVLKNGIVNSAKDLWA
jgi:hypothetical protein